MINVLFLYLDLLYYIFFKFFAFCSILDAWPLVNQLS